MKIRFNDTGEFLEELSKDKPDHNIIRLTNLYTPTKISPNIEIVQVVATYTVNGQLVRFEKYCGDHWGINAESDEKTEKRAQAVQEKIREHCKELDYEVRAGVIEE